MPFTPGDTPDNRESKRGPYGGPIAANYPREQWWVAATSEEITREPRQRWILDLPVVLYRKVDGTVVALDDRCPHRWAPLSRGWLDGDDIVCGYHGFQYCPTGACVKVPTQSATPKAARVHAYPVLERSPLVWLWTGDPANAAQASPPPDIHWLHEGGWTTGHGYIHARANYMLLKENVLDLTHFGYVHRKTFKIFDWTRAPAVKVEKGEVEFRLEFPATPLAPVFAAVTGFGGKPIARVNWGRSLSPALHHAGQDFSDPDLGPDTPAQVRFRVLHATTPINPRELHYFWFFGLDRTLSDSQVEQFRGMTIAGFREDEDMLEAVQGIIERDPRGAHYPEVMVATDRSAVEARRLLEARLRRERTAQKESHESDPQDGKSHHR